MTSAPAQAKQAKWGLPETQLSDVGLDHYALGHLKAFAHQACEYSGSIGHETSTSWDDLIVDAALALLRSLLPEHFEALSATRLSIAEATSQLEAEAASIKSSKDDSKTAASAADAIVQRAQKLIAERACDEKQSFTRLAALLLHVHFDTSTTERSCHYASDVFEGHQLFEEHKGHQHHLDASVWQTIGGTLHVKCSKEDVHKLLKPIQLTVFAAIQLKLEAHWLRDTLSTRLPPLPPITPTEREARVSEQSVASTIASAESATRPPLFPTDTQSSQASLALKQTERWSRNNLWGVLLGKEEEHKAEGSPWRTRFRQSISRGLKKRRLKRAATQDEDWLVVEKSEKSARPTLLKTMFERTSTEPPMLSSVDSKVNDKKVEELPPAAVVEEEPEGRFAKVIARMASTVLSTSTAVRFGPPHLLERLRLQEIQEERSHALQERPSVVRQRSFPTADADTLANSFAEAVKVPASSVSKHSGKMAAETRAAFASLSSNNASLTGMIRHQSIQYLVGCKRLDYKAGDSACHVLRTETVGYYHFAALDDDPAWTSDQRVGEWVAHHARAARQTCPAPGCEKAMEEHQVTFLHNDSRIDMCLSRADAKTPFELEGEITIWAGCATCGQAVRPTIMSAATKLMSFSKLLELLFYDSKMLPEDESACQHMLDSHFAVVRCFRYRDVVVRLQHSPINLYELRMPTPLTDDSRVDDPPSPPHLAQEQEKESLRQDIRKLGAALIERFEAIETILNSRADNKMAHTTLSKLRTAHTKAEHGLLKKVRETPLDSLNDARYACRKHYESILDQLVQTESEVLDKKERASLGNAVTRPSFMQPGYHALPAGNAVVAREDEPASLIAFALSASLFRKEMASIYAELDETHAAAHWIDPGHSSLMDSQSSISSDMSTTPSLKTDDFEQSVSIEKNENLRQVKSLLTLGQRSPQNSMAARFQRIVSEPAKPAESPSKSEPSSPLTVEKRDDSTLLENLLVSKETTPMARRTSSIDPNKVPKLIANLSTPSKQAIPDLTASTPEAVFSASVQTPKASTRKPAKVDFSADEDHDDMLMGANESVTPMRHQASSHSLSSQHSQTSSAGPADSARSSVLSTLWTNAPWRGDKVMPGVARSSSVRKLAQSEDRKRHIKYAFRDRERHFTVTAWDAARFGKLRRQCGIREQAFIDSLSRCSKWTTTGGKSKSAFFMTGDKRFVLKQMLDAWTGSERDSMLAFSTDYFRYFQATSSQRPSLIAKLFGVFSIFIKDDKSGDERKLDLVVMENLFAAHAVSHTFDLKGIAARVSKAATEDSVQWDSAWVSRYSNSVLVHAYSKAVIREAVANDSTWLANCGIMDYSALLGVSEEEHALILGIIDVLGSFNLAKYVEHRAKSALRSSGKDVTILPPADYAERFRKALESYLVAVPEKWSSSPAIDSRRASLPCPL